MKRILVSNLSHRDQILNEIALSYMSSHKNIITIYEAYEYNFSIWIVEELMVCSLSELIQSNKGKINEDVLGYIIKEVCSAIAVLHNNHRIHRDIKSENILISKDGAIKLADLGSAAQLLEENNQRHTIIGTPA